MAKFQKKSQVVPVPAVEEVIEEIAPAIEEASSAQPVDVEAATQAVIAETVSPAKFNFQKALEAMECRSFKHRKVTAMGKEITMIKIPSLLLAAMADVEFTSVPGHSAKQQFEKFVLDTVAPGKSSSMSNEEITKMVSHTTDAWFPKDAGEYQTHPIQREIGSTPRGLRPVRYFYQEVANAEDGIGGTRCAPRPVGTGVNKEAAALKASAAIIDDETVKAALLAKAASLESPRQARNPNAKEIKALELAASVMGEGEAKTAILAKIAALS